MAGRVSFWEGRQWAEAGGWEGGCGVRGDGGMGGGWVGWVGVKEDESLCVLGGGREEEG